LGECGAATLLLSKPAITICGYRFSALQSAIRAKADFDYPIPSVEE
jgi:hypothetical protein